VDKFVLTEVKTASSVGYRLFSRVRMSLGSSATHSTGKAPKPWIWSCAAKTLAPRWSKLERAVLSGPSVRCLGHTTLS